MSAEHDVVEPWFVACESRELGPRPLARTLLGRPTVLFRARDGRAAALVDRCPHRNVPLSAGRVAATGLECAYHGWSFDRDGNCTGVPGLAGLSGLRARNAEAIAVAEQDGYVWFLDGPGRVPATPPPRSAAAATSGIAIARERVCFPAALAEVAENILDVPHTRFLHGGLFRRRREAHEVEVCVRRFAERVEAEYIGEPRPSGLIGRLLAPGGGQVRHVDRFRLPAIAEVEYRLGETSRLVVTSFLTPASESSTWMHAEVAWRTPLPAWLTRLAVAPIARRILAQDAAILRLQTDNLRRFGEARFASTELDVLGAHIRDLLRPRGEPRTNEAASPLERRFRMRI